MNTTIDNVQDFTKILHGSGVNSDWYIEDKKNFIIAYNKFHSMNDAGMYDYITNFKIRFSKNNHMSEFKLFISGYACRKYDLKAYLTDNIYSIIEEMKL